MADQHARVEWRAGDVPVATGFDDPYFSLHDGLAETRHVFLDGNGLPGRLRPGFHVAELGFGTGLNLLATLAAAGDCPGPMRYTAFEAFPMAPADMARALAVFPDLPAAPLLAHWGAGRRRFALGAFEVEVIIGDAREKLPGWSGRADAWFLDGFAPARNPELWEPALLAQVGAHTARGGSFATYTAAGAVRRALAAAGFMVERVPGFGNKRHMSRGRMP
ncbi:tRNA (5-methylaminomethyl-2-thiouridine)(34)-methyltransferase MnmD [Rhodobacteraceae bacterium 2376]|uniref:tRNA (5-methylaminomethyl-2-thiouridine)(34)-methyltransferase MnmD n=1 Tax=Rhabdonatronobacter sediminivivens TaxID=2743469 RepID=A0A7Z0HXK7_9RHOB|nr:tRNA (5-methylaminomethyl-2-thiouridine)(34)-methyltransferase MnmD [Rhabdonatronobacter sediminivivens]NYS24150.1 tRNA (5-methylaminomethyl-2-thiouridine)(34)-methyltransferase MnmD [Rhabdonatronobacter sediminivivens]